MKRIISAAIFTLWSISAQAQGGQHDRSDAKFNAPAVVAQDVVSIAEKYLGSRKFTRFPGPWCADAVNVWLQLAGRPPLGGRMAASALAYGPVVPRAARGDLIVVKTRWGRYGHVGIVVADLGDEIVFISGNWSHRVVESRISRRSVAALIKV
jgi:hypothetical protein